MSKPVRDVVLDVLLSVPGKRWRLPELRDAVQQRQDKPVLETTISAKLRDLRKHPYGSHDVRSELLSGRTWVYFVPVQP